MAKKNPKTGEDPKFVVKKRVPKEKPNFFQNIPDIKSRLNSHPLAEIFDFPTNESQEPDNLDSQTDLSDISKQSSFGNPKTNRLDSQTINTGNPSEIDLDSQNLVTGNPIIKSLDIQNSVTGNPKAENLEIQQPKLGNSKAENQGNLDSNIAKAEVWLSKSGQNLDSNIAKEGNLDSQTSAKKGKWKQYEKKRSTVPVFIRADEDLVNEVKHFNVENKLDMKEFFELSSRRFIDSFGNPNNSDLDIKIALDDRRLMIMFKTKPNIINLFREYNRILTPNSEWKPKDDTVGVKYNNVDIRIIEMGIITTQTNILENDSDTQVSRFKYYTREIDKILAFGFAPETMDVMLQTYRKRWKELTKKPIDLSFMEKEKDAI